MIVDTKEDLIKATIQQLLRVARKYSRIEELPIQINKGLEVTTREAHVIQAVGERTQISVTGLASYFGITKSAASQMVAKLAKKGFLEKQQAPHSNKELQVSLTQLGWQAFHAHELFHGKDMTNLVEQLSAFSLSQIATISVLLEAIGGVMDERLAHLPEKN
jgi:DNA-binding MarR family transcriptional regulator